MVFGAGALGGAASSLVVWLCSAYGVNHIMGVSMLAELSPHGFYPRIVWGGLWGGIFLFGAMSCRPLSQGLILSLVPTLVQLLIIFPFYRHLGFAGIELGLLTPVLVALFNAVWGVTTAISLRIS